MLSKKISLRLLGILHAFSEYCRSADLAGHKLLATSVRTGDTEVFVADPTTGDLFKVSRSPKSEDRYPCWSPDGKRVFFVSDREGTTNLWICNADGSKVRRLNRAAAVCYPNPYSGPPPVSIESDTGELHWQHADQKRGVITIATSRSRASESAAGWSFTLGELATTWWLLEVDR